MSSNTVAEFAAELGKPTSVLLEQLSGAGVDKRAGNDMLTESDKQKLLGYLKAAHGTATGERKKITLTTAGGAQIVISGEGITVQCPGQITVKAATYGGNCGAEAGNKSGFVADECNGRQRCTYQIDYRRR